VRQHVETETKKETFRFTFLFDLLFSTQDAFLNRSGREGKFEGLLEHNKNKINDLTDIRQELEQELLKVKFSGSANDAERDEVQECREEITRVKRRMKERVRKQAGIEANLIRVRSLPLLSPLSLALARAAAPRPESQNHEISCGFSNNLEFIFGGLQNSPLWPAPLLLSYFKQPEFPPYACGRPTNQAGGGGL